MKINACDFDLCRFILLLQFAIVDYSFFYFCRMKQNFINPVMFVIVFSLGSTEIVGVSLLAREDKESVRWLIGAFKENNGEWPKTRVILNDKEFTERVVFTDLFPSAQLEICLFHTFKTFRREVIMFLMFVV